MGSKLIKVVLVASVAGVTAAVVSAAVSTYRDAAAIAPRHWDFGW